jgi:hypothetical protein
MDNENVTTAEEEVLAITRQMLDAMYTADPEVHRRHCAEDMSSYEWYITSHRIDGAEFHLKLIEKGGNGTPNQLDLLTPRIQVYGDTAIVNYTLLKTVFPAIGMLMSPEFSTINETRVFVKLAGVWKMVHLHKSPT